MRRLRARRRQPAPVRAAVVRRRPAGDRGCRLLGRRRIGLRQLRDAGRRRPFFVGLGEDGVGQAAAVLAEALARRAGLAASPVLLALHHGEQYGVGLLDRQGGVDAIGEGLHGPARRGRPRAVELAVVAADALAAPSAARARACRDPWGSPRPAAALQRLARARRDRDDDGCREGGHGLGRAGRRGCDRPEGGLGLRHDDVLARTLIRPARSWRRRSAWRASGSLASLSEGMTYAATANPPKIRKRPPALLMVSSHTPTDHARHPAHTLHGRTLARRCRRSSVAQGTLPTRRPRDGPARRSAIPYFAPNCGT